MVNYRTVLKLAVCLGCFLLGLFLSCDPTPVRKVDYVVKDSTRLVDSTVIREQVIPVYLPIGETDTIESVASNGLYKIDEFITRKDSGWYKLTAFSDKPATLFDVAITGSPVFITKRDTVKLRYEYLGRVEKTTEYIELQQFFALLAFCGHEPITQTWFGGIDAEFTVFNLGLTATVEYPFNASIQASLPIYSVTR